jgi:hypothetical protein
LSETVRRESARLAILTRYKGAGSPEVEEVRRNLAAAKLEQYIGRVVSAAPPLTNAQRDRVIRALTPTI